MPQVPPIAPWADAYLDLMSSMEAWIHESAKRNQHAAWLGGHDEGTFTSSWFPYYLLTGDEQALGFLHLLRDGFLAFAQERFDHGYYAQGEAHHQPEPFIFFMTRLFHLDPSYEPVVAAIEHAAEHVGNWVDGIPAWYDWERHRFLSWKIGTRQVEAAPPWDHEVPDHVRFVQLALTAYLATKRQRYLDFCMDYASKWANLIVESETVPGYLLNHTAERYPDDIRAKAAMSEIENVELHISAGTADSLLDLYELVAEPLYADAARRLLALALPALADPYSHPVAAQLLKYREATGDTSFDEPVMDIVQAMDQPSRVASALLLIDDRDEPHPMGIGRRKDGVKWGYRRHDGSIAEERGPSPTALMLAYRITGRQRYLAPALHTAARRLRLACRVLPDGRHHGCAGATIGAVASGHGRACGIGNVTGTLAPAAFAAYRFANGDKPRVRYQKPDGTVGLPKGVAALVETGETGAEVLLFNSNDEPAAAQVLPDGAADPVAVALPPGEEVRVPV